MELRIDKKKEELKKHTITYKKGKDDKPITIANITTHNGIKVILTNTNSYPFELRIEIITPGRKGDIPIIMQKWIKTYDVCMQIKFNTKSDLNTYIDTFIGWLETIPTNVERKKLLIQNLKTQIKNNPSTAIMVMLEMYNRQTELEKQLKTSNIINWLGFTKHDSRFMSEVCEQISKKGSHSIKHHYTQICHRMQKYASQYLQTRKVI